MQTKTDHIYNNDEDLIMETKTNHIYNTAIAYACYKGGSKRVNDTLLKNMFKDLC